MKIGDHYYLVYPHTQCMAYKVLIKSEVRYKSSCRYDVVSVEFLKQFNIKDGWLDSATYEKKYPTKKPFTGVYPAKTRNLYASWDEALVQIKAIKAEVEEEQRKSISYYQSQLRLAKENLEQAIEHHQKTVDLDIEKLFNNNPDSYISPFTGERQ